MEKVKTRPFGNLPAGEAVVEYTLTNTHGLILKFITYGGIITELHAPDRRGVTSDVVLGFKDLAGYLGPHPYFGGIIGRVAGRITGGKFTLAGHTYQLSINDPPNHLHGGAVGFDKRLWQAEILNTPDGTASVKLAYRSPRGEEGYPGNVDVRVIYSLTEANEIIIRYEATTDHATPLSLTNHSYFNLAGDGNGTIKDHHLAIVSAETTSTDENMTLLGIRSPVAGKASDFRHSRRLGDAIPHLLKSHGDNYLLTHSLPKSLDLVARLEEPQSGRVMEVLTTEDCLQMYTSAHLDESLTGKSGRPYARFGGLALECQGYPDGVNHPELGNIILRPGETYQQTTVYRLCNQ